MHVPRSPAARTAAFAATLLAAAPAAAGAGCPAADGSRPAADVRALLKACHDRAWSLPAFRGVPNAGVSVHRSSCSATTVVAYWIVDWQDIQAAGRCTGDRRTGRLSAFSRFGR